MLSNNKTTVRDRETAQYKERFLSAHMGCAHEGHWHDLAWLSQCVIILRAGTVRAALFDRATVQIKLEDLPCSGLWRILHPY